MKYLRVVLVVIALSMASTAAAGPIYHQTTQELFGSESLIDIKSFKTELFKDGWSGEFEFEADHDRNGLILYLDERSETAMFERFDFSNKKPAFRIGNRPITDVRFKPDNDTAKASVPEPSTLLLAGLGLVGLVTKVRRRK